MREGRNRRRSSGGLCFGRGAHAGGGCRAAGTMTTRRQFLAASAAAICSAASVAAQASPLREDAMWVWGEPILAPDRALPDFADRRRIATLYVYVSPAAADALLSGRREAVEAVKAMAAQRPAPLRRRRRARLDARRRRTSGSCGIACSAHPNNSPFRRAAFRRRA